jgi:hypothetical protein
MRRKMKKTQTMFVFVVLTLSIIATSVKADNYGKSTVYVNIPSDTSFTLTVLGCSGSNIIGTTEGGATSTTGDISFNATTTPENNINAQSVGACTQLQSGATNPIYQYDPTGNVPLNFSLRFENALPGWITVEASGVTYGVSCSGAGVNTVQITNTYTTVAYNIAQANCIANVTLTADVTAGASAGITSLGSLYSRSQKA